MGLGINKENMSNAFGPVDGNKRIRKFRKKFADEEVFGLTGRLVKRSKRFGQ